MNPEALLTAQTEWFARVDRALPEPTPPDPGEVITAALPDGRRVAGVVSRVAAGPGSLNSLWSARQTWELFPLVGDTGGAGMDALLRSLRRWLDKLGSVGDDTACLVTWPSRDAEATRVFLDHGLQALTVVAVRPPTPIPPPAMTVTVRRATPGDIDAVARLAMAELGYSALVGAAVIRPDAGHIRRAALAGRITRGEAIWLAERDGVELALAETAVVPASPMLKIGRQLFAGRWGYVNCLSVLPGARRSGIGQQLMAVVHAEWAAQRVVGHYLHYNPANPLSSVFWPRQGYRPLWTQWEVRPVTALR
ncbi:MAG: GNAT family N-acetyltransferase [Kutzneria sp.]|nr:GNAT family N-acetyltransferase [Kutzneria sp.]